MSAPRPDVVVASLRTYLLEEILDEEEAAEIAEDEDLIAGGLLDSIAAVRLAGYIEDLYSIEVKPSDFTPENFRSLSALASFICREVADVA